MFKSLPLTTREIKATEQRLLDIYEAAALGLKGDSLALAAGMLPVEYRRLCELDPMAAMAEAKGRADSESEAARQLRDAARNGDSKAALAILQHVHGWTAKTAVQVDVTQQISITAALQEAESRVINGRVLQATQAALSNAIMDEAPNRSSGSRLLTNQPIAEADYGYRDSNAETSERVAAVRP
jgi:hypothetical protein